MTFRSLLGAFACASIIAASPQPAAVADFCELSWDKPCCRIPGADLGMAEVALTICNCTETPQEYTFELSSPVPGVQFSPATGSVSLQPGECIDLTIDVFCPPTDQDTLIDIFALISNSDGPVAKCVGVVRNVSTVKADPVDPVVPVPNPTQPTTATINLAVSELQGVGAQANIFFESMSDMIVAPDMITLQLGPNQTVIEPVEVQLLPAVQQAAAEGAIGGPATGALLIAWDLHGDGNVEVASSVNFRFEEALCPGDLNGDGVVDGADLAILLANWGVCP